MPTKHSDGELIAACINRQEWAWDALVERYQRLVYSVALRSSLGQDDAADVFQNVFTLLLQHVEGLRDPQGLAAWLITTSKRESWRLLRKQQREPPQDDDTLAALAAAEEWLSHSQPEEAQWADHALVREALDVLGGRCKELLALLYADPGEPSYEQISKRLRIPLGSIGPTRARCLQKMRDILQSMGMTEA